MWCKIECFQVLRKRQVPSQSRSLPIRMTFVSWRSIQTSLLPRHAAWFFHIPSLHFQKLNRLAWPTMKFKNDNTSFPITWTKLQFDSKLLLSHWKKQSTVWDPRTQFLLFTLFSQQSKQKRYTKEEVQGKNKHQALQLHENELWLTSIFHPQEQKKIQK